MGCKYIKNPKNIFIFFLYVCIFFIILQASREFYLWLDVCFINIFEIIFRLNHNSNFWRKNHTDNIRWLWNLLRKTKLKINNEGHFNRCHVSVRDLPERGRISSFPLLHRKHWLGWQNCWNPISCGKKDLCLSLIVPSSATDVVHVLVSIHWQRSAVFINHVTLAMWVEMVLDGDTMCLTN